MSIFIDDSESIKCLIMLYYDCVTGTHGANIPLKSREEDEQKTYSIVSFTAFYHSCFEEQWAYSMGRDRRECIIKNKHKMTGEKMKIRLSCVLMLVWWQFKRMKIKIYIHWRRLKNVMNLQWWLRNWEAHNIGNIGSKVLHVCDLNSQYEI